MAETKHILEILKEVGVDTEEREYAHKFKNWVEYADEQVHKYKIMKFRHLELMLKKKFKISPKEAHSVIINGEYEYRFLLSTDNYVIDFEYYRMVTKDKFFDFVYLNQSPGKVAIPFASLVLDEDKEMLEALYVVTATTPYSKSVKRLDGPFALSFIKEGKQKDECDIYYQIAYFTKKNIKARIMQITENEKVEKKNRPYLKRIAVVEDANLLNEIPYCGFNQIIKIDNDKIVNLQIRKNPWSEDESI